MAHGVNEGWISGSTSPDVDPSGQQEKKRAKASSVRDGKSVGSRRIFSPQFKLRVLDSYRKDPDCRGNQRATARKYGIHRRQIQKWLQMESTLRCNAEASAEGGGGAALNLVSARQHDDSSPCSAGCLPAPETPPPDEEEELNVDKVSDSEDDVSSNSSLYDQDRALDFTCAALSKRRFFSPPFKLEVVDAFRTDPDCAGNQRATARKFGVHRRQVQKWLNQEPLLRGTPVPPPECLDLSKKRKIPPGDHPDPKRPLVDPETPEKPTSLQETALCLVKQPTPSPEVTSSVDLYRPYDLDYSPQKHTTYDIAPWCPPYCSFYSNSLSTVYVTGWLNHEASFYKQTLHEMHSYTMHTHS